MFIFKVMWFIMHWKFWNHVDICLFVLCCTYLVSIDWVCLVHNPNTFIFIILYLYILCIFKVIDNESHRFMFLKCVFICNFQQNCANMLNLHSFIFLFQNLYFLHCSMVFFGKYKNMFILYHIFLPTSNKIFR